MTEFSQTDPQFQAEFWMDEPDYEYLASFGDGVLATLEELVDGDNLMLAQRAIFVAGLLDGGAGIPLLEKASRDSRETVRVAVSGAVRSKSIQEIARAGTAPPTSSLRAIISRLLTDHDSSVRKWTAKSAGILGLNSMRSELERLAHGDAEAFVRTAAKEALKQVDP